MFENNTYQAILKRMLDRIPDKFDKREGSILYDALAPAAAELQIAYISLEAVFREMFADTASRDCLIRRAAERGIAPYPATHAILRGAFIPADISIPSGTRFRCGEYNYFIIAKIADGEYQLQCETIGSAGNAVFGTLIPIDYISGLETCELEELLIPGEDEEETEHLRKRYFDSLESQAFGGNVADYKEKVAAIHGVGGVKVYPAWDGGGTVKLVIISSDYQVPTSALIQSVQDQIDPLPDSGKGYGIAPIGHHVTVVPVDYVTVNLELSLIYRTGYDFSSVGASIEELVDAYFYELNKEWANSECLVIRISRLESRILELPGILDITETKFNGEAKNLVLGKNEIAVRGTVRETGS